MNVLWHRKRFLHWVRKARRVSGRRFVDLGGLR